MHTANLSCQDIDWFIATRCDVARTTPEPSVREKAFAMIAASLDDPESHPRRSGAEYLHDALAA